MLILILAANTIQNHRGPWKTCKISSLKIALSACHVTGHTWNVNSCNGVTDIIRTESPKILKTALSSAWSSLATSVLVSCKTSTLYNRHINRLQQLNTNLSGIGILGCIAYGIKRTLKYNFSLIKRTFELSGCLQQDTCAGIWFDGRIRDWRQPTPGEHMHVWNVGKS